MSAQTQTAAAVKGIGPVLAIQICKQEETRCPIPGY